MFFSGETSKESEIFYRCKKQEEIIVVRDFPEVFPNDLSRLPSIREIKFRIELIPGATLFFSKMDLRSGYRQLRVHKDDIQRLLLELKCKTFDWGEEHELAFQTLKDKLCNAPVLALPNGLKDFVSTSTYGLHPLSGFSPHPLKAPIFDPAAPKALTTAATTVTSVSTRPKGKGIIMQEPFKTPSLKPIVYSQQPSQPKDKGKAKMVEPERPLKKKEQIMMDEQIARDLEAQTQGDLEEEKRIAKQTKEEANIAMIVEWDNTHAMMDADYELAEKLQEEERG
nr:hypothetical protein [Tanacetum cinerariifolium]